MAYMSTFHLRGFFLFKVKAIMLDMLTLPGRAVHKLIAHKTYSTSSEPFTGRGLRNRQIKNTLPTFKLNWQILSSILAPTGVSFFDLFIY